MELTKSSCEGFLESLASKAPAPGGGGAAALVGAAGVALGNMVGSLTVGKKKYAAVEADIRTLNARAEVLRRRLEALVQADAEAFMPLAAAYGLPKETPEQQAHKAAVLEQALEGACAVPLEIMEACCEGIALAQEYAAKGSVLAVSDAGCAALFCKAALQASGLNVSINTKLMADRAHAEALNAKADALLAQLDFVRYVDIAPGLALEDYYRTDPHWRQECLVPTAQTLAQAMDVPLAGDFQENAVDTPFFGSYAGKTDEPLTADTLRYLIGGTLDACTVYDYETEAQEGLYDLSAVDTKTPYDLYLQGSKSLLRVDSPLSASEETLVVFRDSFGSSLIPLLAQHYRTIYAVDIRYLSSQLLGRFLTLDGGEDVLFLYSTMVLNNSRTMK